MTVRGDESSGGARSPNHNSVCDRFPGRVLEECWRVAFHRRHFTSLRQRQGEVRL